MRAESDNCFSSFFSLILVEIPRTDIGSGYNPLDSFFPFDPYLLRESSKFIAPLYVNWSDVVDGISVSTI